MANSPEREWAVVVAGWSATVVLASSQRVSVEMSLTQIHGVVANAFSIFALIVTLLAAFQLIRRQPLGGNFWGAVAIGEGLVVVQAILGIILLIRGGQPGRGIHFLYGALSVLAWPASYAYSQGQSENRAALIWTLVSAFLFGLSIRAVTTGLPQ